MRIVEDNEHRLLIIARPWLAWFCAWPPLLAGAIAVVWAELVGERSAAWIVLALGMACLPFLDYSVRVEADKANKTLSIRTRWLWRRQKFWVRFREVVAINHEVDTSQLRSSHLIVVQLGYRRAVTLRHASWFCDYDKIAAALGSAISPRVRPETIEY